MVQVTTALLILGVLLNTTILWLWHKVIKLVLLDSTTLFIIKIKQHKSNSNNNSLDSANNSGLADTRITQDDKYRNGKQ